MTTVTREIEFPIDADTLWRTIGDFHGLADWHPAIESSTPEEDGAVRRLTLGGGSGEVVERLVDADAARHSYTYTILDSPLPLADYVATLSVSASGSGCILHWSGEFQPSGAPEANAIAAVEMVYDSGIAALKKRFA
ncbi:MAG: SRPBCC family protein [Alphaproteobacteria bacterium]